MLRSSRNLLAYPFNADHQIQNPVKYSMIWCACLILRENPVIQFGYLRSTLVVVGGMGISPTLCLAVPYCWMNLWVVGSPSFLSQCTRKLWAPKCSPNPCVLLRGKQWLGILVAGPWTSTKVSFVAFLGWVEVPSGSTHRNSSSLPGLQSMVIIHLLN